MYCGQWLQTMKRFCKWSIWVFHLRFQQENMSKFQLNLSVTFRSFLFRWDCLSIRHSSCRASSSAAGVVVSCKIPILATRVRFPAGAQRAAIYFLTPSWNTAAAVGIESFPSKGSMGMRFSFLFPFFFLLWTRSAFSNSSSSPPPLLNYLFVYYCIIMIIFPVAVRPIV